MKLQMSHERKIGYVQSKKWNYIGKLALKCLNVFSLVCHTNTITKEILNKLKKIIIEIT